LEGGVKRASILKILLLPTEGPVLAGEEDQRAWRKKDATYPSGHQGKMAAHKKNLRTRIISRKKVRNPV